MSAILDMFSSCDTFSLTSNLPITSIDKVSKDFLLNNQLNKEKERLKPYYDKSMKEGASLPSYDSFFDEITNEVKCFMKKYPVIDIYYGDSPFICDHVGKDTKYSEPIQYIWHFYHIIHHCLMSLESLIGLDACEKFEPVQLDKECNKELKPYFLRYEFTYDTHCTSGPLQVVYYFALNEKTRSWLNQFKTDYSFYEKGAIDSGFEDLALYKNGKLEFSSCTHEQINSIDTPF